jgi:ribosomal-protein-alanine N-acetyltransferase
MRIPFPGGVLRPWTPADIPDLARLADNRGVWRNLRDGFPSPYTKKDARDWIRGVSRMLPCMHFAVDVATLGEANASAGVPATLAGVPATLAGGIGLIPQEDMHKGTAEIGYWLGEPFWGRGIMTAALRSFSAYAFDAYGLRRLYARVLEWNPASMRVLEKAGYALEGRMRASALKDGRVADEMLYGLVRMPATA